MRDGSLPGAERFVGVVAMRSKFIWIAGAEFNGSGISRVKCVDNRKPRSDERECSGQERRAEGSDSVKVQWFREEKGDHCTVIAGLGSPCKMC
jgi:hypothetical protein